MTGSSASQVAGTITSGSASVDRGRPQCARAAAGLEQDLGDLGAEHVAGVVEQGDERGVELRRVLEDAARLVEQLEPLVLLALGDVGAVGEEHRRRAERRAAQTAIGLIHMTVTASRARLVLASATIAPNRTISGSFWNCGAPPDSEIAVAIAKTHTTLAESVAANAAIQSVGPGMPVGAAIAWKIARSTTAMTAKFARLNAIFTADTRDVSSIAIADPISTATMYSFGREEEQAGDGRDLAAARTSATRAGSGRR